MVMLIVAVLLASVPSLTRNVTASDPLELRFGVYEKAPVDALVIVAVPLLPLVRMREVSASPSTSVADSVPGAAVSSFVVSEPLLATGASLTAAIVTVIVAVLLFTVPSFTLKVNESDPLALAL